MGARGRKSAADLTVVAGAGVATALRPEPPGELTAEQAHEWRAIVNRLPPDWFGRETHPLLVQLCRHTVTARRVAKLINKIEGAKKVVVAEYDRLLKAQERESRWIASLSVKLRISQSTNYDKSRKRPPQTEKPWDDDG